jgi:nucleotide-binding universal stress UspA family protein
MYQRIVVGTDGSDGASTAVEHAAALARLCGAELHLVQGSGSAVVTAPLYGEVIAVDPHQIVQACKEQLEPTADRLRSTGLDVSIHVVAAAGHAALCDVAEQLDADLIVVGNRGMSGARRFLGSVPNSVAHQAPCSVLIVATH